MVAQLKAINADIQLKLPSNPVSIQRQLQRVLQAQTQLTRLQADLDRSFGRQHNPSVRVAYMVLLDLVQQTTQATLNYKMLAEEFSLDPHGSIRCLLTIRQTTAATLDQLNELETLELMKDSASLHV
jgi:hypothetical protein